jgi:hypothetical protein
VQVEPGEKIAIDWTFAAIKNYNLDKAKAVFTCNKATTKEIVILAIVPSTAVSQVSHCLVQARLKRKNFQPSVLYHDTCPNNDSFWKALLGLELVTRLGLFHLLHRIVETLDPKCEGYWKCLVQLKKSVYSYKTEPMDALMKSMAEGTFSRTGRQWGAKEIDDLRHSKAWKSVCDPFLQKEILGGNEMIHNLQLWIETWKSYSDATGRPVFSRNTEKSTREQFNKVSYASDPPNMEMYKEIPPGPMSTHNLPKWQSLRAESALEKFHEFLAHLANTGTNKDLADTLTLGGTAKNNVKCRWKHHVNQKKLDGADIKIPGNFEDEPPFWDHSLLASINAEATRHGLASLFDFVAPIEEDNGEEFLSEYFTSQMDRNETVGQDNRTSFCKCSTCERYEPLPRSAEQFGVSVMPEQQTEVGVQDEQIVVPPQQYIAEIVAPAPILAQPSNPPVPLAIRDPRVIAWCASKYPVCSSSFPFYCDDKYKKLYKICSGERALGRHKHSPFCAVKTRVFSPYWWLKQD